VAAPDAWMFKRTGVRAGSRFPALVGVEFDRIDPSIQLERPTEVVAHSPLVLHGAPSHSDAAYYTHRGGAGVFSVGTMRWVPSFARPLYHWGITRATSAFTRRVTANVLHAFADGPAAAKYPARDNLARWHL
jgi:N,N-dimethylformamidase beta subunit-like protein